MSRDSERVSDLETILQEMGGVAHTSDLKPRLGVLWGLEGRNITDALTRAARRSNHQTDSDDDGVWYLDAPASVVLARAMRNGWNAYRGTLLRIAKAGDDRKLSRRLEMLAMNQGQAVGLTQDEIIADIEAAVA